MTERITTHQIFQQSRNRVAIEAGVTDYWNKYIGLDGLAFGVNNFGESAPAKDVFEYFGLTENNLKKVIGEYLVSMEIIKD